HIGEARSHERMHEYELVHTTRMNDQHQMHEYGSTTLGRHAHLEEYTNMKLAVHTSRMHDQPQIGLKHK
ncbi:hypothetical protein, partial [Klebsiella variicola]|uniref:hypothetical protein n=1 Tax=Klebsiella variicola TaxID=244366 RepID=UPI00272F5067